MADPMTLTAWPGRTPKTSALSRRCDEDLRRGEMHPDAIKQAREYCAVYPQAPYTVWLKLALDRIDELGAFVREVATVPIATDEAIPLVCEWRKKARAAIGGLPPK